MSRVVIPLENPRICVCTAALTPTVHRSLLIEVIAGAMADGGGDLTVVSLYELFVLLEVESVIIGSACAKTVTEPNITKANKIFFNILHS